MQTIEELDELIERHALNAEMGAVAESLGREMIVMPLSRKDRQSLARQLFEAVAEVGFLTWQAQHREDYQALLAEHTKQQLREEYVRCFEGAGAGWIREMARTAPDDRLTATLADWRKRTVAMQRDADLALKERGARDGKTSLAGLKQPGRPKSRDKGLER